MTKESEQLPSGKLVLRTLDVEGRLVQEMHSYGMLEIACTMEFAAGKKIGESYVVKKRVAGRKRYEKARLDYPDMPAADETLSDTGAELIRLMGIERKQKAAANKRRKENPPTDKQKREAARQIPLFQAASGEDIDALRRLLDEGEDPNAIHLVGRFTPLYNACAFGSMKPEQSLAAVRLLLERGADPNMRFDFDSMIDGRLERGLTALMIAGTAEVAEALLAAGAEVNAASADGVTPLMRAAGSGRVEVVRVLLAAGANANARSDAGHVAADFAASKLEFLLKNGAGFKPGHAEKRGNEFRKVLRLLGAND